MSRLLGNRGVDTTCAATDGGESRTGHPTLASPTISSCQLGFRVWRGGGGQIVTI